MSNADSVIYNIDNLIDYATCPYKYRFRVSEPSKNNKYINTDNRDRIGSILRSIYIHHLVQKGLGNNLTLRALNVAFSKALVKEKLIGVQGFQVNNISSISHETANNSVIINPTELISYLESIRNFYALIDVYEKNHFHIVAVEYPIERKFIDRNETSFSIRSNQDVILYNESSGNKILLCISFDHKFSNNFGTTLKACLNYVQIKRELTGENVNVNNIILDPFSLKQTEVKLDQDHRLNYPRILKSLVESIQNKVYYPRVSNGACEHCVYQNKCIWSFKKK